MSLALVSVYKGLIEWVRKCSLPFKFLDEFEKDRYSFFVKYLVKFTNEAIKSRACFFLFLSFFLFFLFLSFPFFSFSLSLLIQSPYWLYFYSEFLLLCDLVFVGFIFLGICSFHLGYLICWHTVVHSTLLKSFLFL